MNQQNAEFGAWRETYDFLLTVHEHQISQGQLHRMYQEAFERAHPPKSDTPDWQQKQKNAKARLRHWERKRDPLEKKIDDAFSLLSSPIDYTSARAPPLDHSILAAASLRETELAQAILQTNLDAVLIAATLKLKSSGPAMIKVLQSPVASYSFKLDAAEALGSIGYGRAPPILLNILQDRGENNWLKNAALRGILHFQESRTINKAISILNQLGADILDNGASTSLFSDHGLWLVPEVRDYSSNGMLLDEDAIGLLREYKVDNPRMVPPLIELFQSSSIELKHTAEQYIASFRSAALPYLRAAKQNHPHRAVREEVPYVISKIQKPVFQTLNERKMAYMRKRYQSLQRRVQTAFRH